MMLTTLLPVSLASALLLAAGSNAQLRNCPPPEMAQGQEVTVEPVSESVIAETQHVIEVVFVLDTTGSMGGLIEGAKQKIWSIANEIALAEPAPIVRMGLVGYRDRGDEYVIKRTDLTSDLDTIYADLMKFDANGGGDTPESVNEALAAAVDQFEWSEDSNALKLIYLVGDAPPQMNYDDDVKYSDSCRGAIEQGIYINTIQCGSLPGTEEIWREIASLAEGSYVAIAQSGGVVRIPTEYDEQINMIDGQIRATMIDYGDPEVMREQESKRFMGRTITAGSSVEALADRAAYNQSAAGRVNYYGSQELVFDYENDRVELEKIEKAHLPEELRELSIEDLREKVDSLLAERKSLEAELEGLTRKRADFISAELKRQGADGFDTKVVETLREQGARKGIRIGGDAEKREEPTAPTEENDS